MVRIDYELIPFIQFSDSHFTWSHFDNCDVAFPVCQKQKEVVGCGVPHLGQGPSGFFNAPAFVENVSDSVG